MYRVELSPEAEADLDKIYEDICDAGFPENAAAFTDRLAAACRSLFQTFPHRGTLRQDLAPGLRLIGFERAATIFFRVSESDRLVVVLRILGKGRSDKKAFKRS